MKKFTLTVLATSLLLAACQPPEADKPTAPSNASGAAVSVPDGGVAVAVNDKACEPMTLTVQVNEPHFTSKMQAVVLWNGRF